MLNKQFIKAGVVFQRYSPNVENNNGLCYTVNFENTSWTLLANEFFEQNVKCFHNTNFCKYGLYTIKKGGQKLGVVMPKNIQSGRRAGKSYLLAIISGNVNNQYYIFDIDKQFKIRHGCCIYFDINHMQAGREKQKTFFNNKEIINENTHLLKIDKDK